MFFPLSFPFRRWHFTPRVREEPFPGPFNCKLSKFREVCFISFSQVGRSIHLKGAAPITKKSAFSHERPASLSPPSPTFVPPIRDLAASRGLKNNGRDKKKKKM
ncbi:hypothetical protein CEXT_655231 [Caerostris extrusa]|uniref:Uncharacterized protein n=1 Tax=Caerostris extrusa TaxID=172846 RepID=A0AAV4XUZ0_CAEEX|nr:hypothetical protein CEXT_655231 [Caerostris extrusa]